MELCSYNHEEVAFSGRKCPVCEMREDKDALMSDRDSTIKDLESANEELDARVAEYKSLWQVAQDDVTRLCKGQLDGEV